MFRRTKPDSASTDQTPPKPGGKGRPTPTRKEAEAAARARAKAAPQGRRELATRERLARLEARDAGPGKRLVRDLVDSRISVMELLIIILPIGLVLSYSGNERLVAFASVLLNVALLVMIVESFLLWFRIRRQVPKRAPGESLRGLTFYGLSRAMMLRVFRRPKPEVRIGETLPELYR